MKKLAYPEITAREDRRRKKWTIKQVEDAITSTTDNENFMLAIPGGDEEDMELVRQHEALHAAHSPGAPANIAQRMAEEVRMDALAYHGGLTNMVKRLDIAPAAAFKITDHPKDAVLWYWQGALTLGSLPDALEGKIAVREEAPADLKDAFQRMVEVMGPLATPAVGWVRALLEHPTEAVRQAAVEWHQKLEEDPKSKPEPGEGEKGEKGGKTGEGEGSGKPSEGKPMNGAPGSGGSSVPRPSTYTRAQPQDCGGTPGSVQVQRRQSDGRFKEDVVRSAMAQQTLRQEITKAQEARAAARAEEEEREEAKRQGAQVRRELAMPPPVLSEAKDGVGIHPFRRSMLHDHLRNGTGQQVKLRRGTRSDGSTVIRPERWRPGDRSVFSARRRGGAMAIDVSGSMRWNWDALNAAMAELPGLTIITSSSRDVTDAEDRRGIRHVPLLCLVADEGRFSYPTPTECGVNGDNGSDLEALQWLATQRGPRIWLSDGKVVCGEIARLIAELGSAKARELVIRVAQQADIVRIQNVEAALAVCRHQKPKGAVISARQHPDQFISRDMFDTHWGHHPHNPTGFRR